MLPLLVSGGLNGTNYGGGGSVEKMAMRWVSL